MVETESRHISPIELCPNEILFHIKEHIHSTPREQEARQHMLALRLTSRRLNAVFTQFTITHRYFAWSIEEQHDGFPDLHVWESRSNKDGLLAPVPDVFIPYISSIDVHFDVEWDYASQIPEQIASQFSPFWDELLRYRSLNSISVSWDDGWSSGGFHDQTDLYYCLAARLWESVHRVTSGRLSSFTWSYPYGEHITAPIAYHSPPFRGADVIYLEIWDAPAKGHLRHSLLGDFLLQNPTVRSLSLVCDTLVGPLCRWEELFPVKLDELALETLFVQGMLPDSPPNLHDASIGHPIIKNLQKIVFSIDHMLLSRQPVAIKNSPNLNSFWLKLRESGAHLTELDLFYGISEALMRYLASYQGLKHLRFDVSALPLTMSPLSTTFSGTVLPQHASSLTYISLSCYGRRLFTGWECMAIDPTTWPKPSTFCHLTDLSVITPKGWNLDITSFQTLIDYVSEIPNLRKFYVMWSSRLGANMGSFDLDIKSIGKEAFINRCSMALFRVSVYGTGRFAPWHGVQWNFTFPPAPVLMENRTERFPMSSFRSAQ